MIEGIKITIAGAELKDLCAKQAREHHDKAVHYQENLKTVQEMSDRNSSFNAAEQVERKISTHSIQAAELQFIADHLDINEIFLLDTNDLVKLGISYRGY